jgi:hypothetical protein
MFTLLNRRGRASIGMPWRACIRPVLPLLLAFASIAALGCRHEPTYHEDIAPILASKCLQCHREDGVGLTKLGSFEQASAAARKIRHSVQTRAMPPWGADNSGLCGTWRDAPWLRDEEMRALDAWTKNPLPGNPSRAKLAVPPPPPAFRASGIVLDTGGDFRPGLGSAAYRCFVVGPADVRDRTATAFRISSSEPRSVAQVTLYAIDSAEADAAAAALDREEEGLGYTCFGSSRVPGTRLLTSWTWDSPVSELPAGYGVRLSGGHKLIVQIHYNSMAAGLDVPTHTRIELALDDAARVATYFTIAPDDFRLPAKQFRTQVRAEVALPRALRVLGVAPRMHSSGRTMQLDRFVSGSFRCMSSFDHWNFYRQRLFVLETPVELEAGSRLRLSCAYSTLGRTEPIRMGERIEDEECLAELLVVDG